MLMIISSLGTANNSNRVKFMEGAGNSSSRVERNMKERVRRKQMRNLLSQLAFLIPPPQTSKNSVPELLEHAANYIKHFQEKVEEQKGRQEALLKESTTCDPNYKKTTSSCSPVLNIKSWEDSYLELNLICRLNENFMLHEIISVLQQEGAEVISCTQNNAADRVIYMIRSKAICPRIGIETARVRERIKDLIF
ncbi:hypothetical protein Dsin_010341 [Dipteronia sinensis]|uniref:BHLH domain-containing protein n=1 Tax=Dipteronia sinensis TaxID=43782 RepID=A0AAE0ASA2_9ROSI|nr:hypothetical protein Dsin_010341 [Dipteronia sinensis]